MPRGHRATKVRCTRGLLSESTNRFHVVAKSAAAAERVRWAPRMLLSTLRGQKDSHTHATAVGCVLQNGANAVFVSFALSRPMGMHACGVSGRTPLHIAATFKSFSVDVVQFLVDAGSDVKAVDEGERTALYTACFWSMPVDLVQVLLKEGKIFWPYTTARGCRKKYFDLVQLLCSFKSDVNARDYVQQTPLHYALKQTSSETFRFLVIDMAADLNAKDSNVKTPLFLAHNTETMRILLEEGANVEIRNSSGATPLVHWASECRLDLVQELIEAGADVTAMDSRSKTAIDRARMVGVEHDEVRTLMDFLLQSYQNQVVRSEGRLSLSWIFQNASYGYITPAEDRSFHPPVNHTRIKTAAGNLSMDQVATLLQLFDYTHNDTAIRSRDANGSIPLHYACQRGAPLEILLLLLHFDGCMDSHALATTPRCRNHQGALPLHVLLTAKPSVEAVRLLLKLYPASASVRTVEGEYPLAIAFKSCASESGIFELLKAYPDLIGT